MRFSWSRIGATAILALFVTAGAGCTLINKIRSKNELNETARAYREGHFEEAEQHAETQRTPAAQQAYRQSFGMPPVLFADTVCHLRCIIHDRPSMASSSKGFSWKEMRNTQPG